MHGQQQPVMAVACSKRMGPIRKAWWITWIWLATRTRKSRRTRDERLSKASTGMKPRSASPRSSFGHLDVGLAAQFGRIGAVEVGRFEKDAPDGVDAGIVGTGDATAGCRSARPVGLSAATTMTISSGLPSGRAMARKPFSRTSSEASKGLA
jgi:hypothetical protein